MEDENVGIEMDEEMEMDEPDGDGSDMEDEEEEIGEDPGSSPFQQPSSGPGSTPTSTASSPPVNDEMLAYPFTGKPLNIRRGPGRPRKEGKPMSRTTKSPVSLKLKKFRTGYGRGMPKRVRSIDRGDSDAASVPQSPSEEGGMLDPETGALILSDRVNVISEEPPYVPEQWPGKVCAVCNLGERSQLGQGDLLRLSSPEGFIPRRILPSELGDSTQSSSVDPEPERENGDKSPRGGPVAVTCRRQKSFNKCRNPSLTNEYVDELTIIGHSDEPDFSLIFETDNTFYIHQSCAMWSSGVIKSEGGDMSNLASLVLQSLSRKCSNCGHYGASLICKVASCSRIYHFPCATAAGAFQDYKTISLFCNQHLAQVPLIYDSTSEVTCITCYALGDVSNLMFCSSCGQHHHGACVGLAQLPGVRAGWQCRDCKVCQICKVIGDESKLMSCEQCDKAYHAMCLRPVVTSVPKYGWKCKCCRICGDCGSRTPGAGQSSRWHAHYTVCDSCYQQRNKGFSCPLCRKAYRAHAYREMVQCSFCRRFVHPKCDPEADLVAYQHKKETNPEYEYVCLACKSLSLANRQMISKRKDSTEDGTESSLSASQDSLLYGDDPYLMDFEFGMDKGYDDGFRVIGLGKGKPYASKIAGKKRLGLPGRPKGVGKGLPGKFGHQKRRGMFDFGRKRGPKSKMRGIFGVPGVGLQRPTADSNNKSEDEPGNENRLVLCSAKDKFVLTQDICVMCGALGTDQEGCLIACAQCGQCYHPYCVNINKVTKIILQKGWRCLDCSICEGCGQKNDEARLILCDECDISYHIYCMDPPLDYVPTGTWKCKWCAMCQTCGSQTPGINSNWMNSFSECGPCASLNTCPYCLENYSEGELVINCNKCDRWIHGGCDSIKTESDAERCSEENYICILCRPKEIPPPHLIPQNIPIKPPSPTKSPEIKPSSTAQYFVDGVYLSENGLNTIKALSMDQSVQGTRKKRRKLTALMDKEAGIMATIESVVAGGTLENKLQDGGAAKLELVEVKEEPQELYKEGMLWTPKTDGAPPEGFTVYTTESGVTMLRRKRQRNLQKLGIGGFLVRMRGTRGCQDNDEVDTLPGQSTSSQPDLPMPLNPPLDADGKPKRKPVRRKPKGKLAESYPVYLQEAFFGRDLLDTVKEKEPDSSSAGEEDQNAKAVTEDKIIHLSQEEIKAIEAIKTKQEKDDPDSIKDDSDMVVSSTTPTTVIPKEEEDSDSEALKDVLALPGDLIDTDLVNTIMNEDNEELAKNADTLESLADSNLGDDGEIANGLQISNSNQDSTTNTKDELSDILGSHFNLDIPNMDSKDVEEIFKGVLTDESQESQESMFPISSNVFSGSNTPTQQPAVQHPVQGVRPTGVLPSVVGQNTLNSPMSFPSQSPYHSEYSNSPQFSPAFSEPPSPWVSASEPPDPEGSLPAVPSTSYNQRSTEKMKVDEMLGSEATISAVLYANMNHPEWKTEYPNWNDRCKQILKKWRALSSDKKAPYLQQARDNRSALRMKKAQQMNKEASSPTEATRTVTAITMTASTTAAAISKPTPPSTTVTTSSDQVEVCTVQQSKQTTQLTIATVTPSNTVSVSTTPVTTPVTTVTTVSTVQQFTVHGQFLSVHNHNGPAPNVTVNPHYQPDPPSSPILRPSIPTPLAADQQIRVLTPSEIMRTLPSLCQDSYDIPVSQITDQDKISHQQKSVREAEQERQWKVMQEKRQQQAQQQQQIIHDQRVQAMARVHRQMSDGPPQFSQESTLQTQLQVSTADTVQSPTTRQFISPAAKGTRPVPQSPTFQQPSLPPPRSDCVPVRPGSLPLQRPLVRQTSQPPSPFSPPAVQSPHEFQPAVSPSQIDNFQRPPSEGVLQSPDPYLQSPQTPRPQFTPGQQSPGQRMNYQPRLSTQDPYAQQPSTPRPAFTAPRQTFIQTQRPQTLIENPEGNRHLRDLLQRQQFKKLDDSSLLPGKQRVWPPPEGQNESQQQQFEGGSPQGSSEVTFRHPLPPGVVRPRIPVSQNTGMLVRQPGQVVGLRLPQNDPRLVGLDPRMRLILQQQQQQRATNPLNVIQQPFQQTQVLQRPQLVRPSVDHFEQVNMQKQIPFQQKQENIAMRLGLNQGVQPRLPGPTQQVPTSTAPTTPVVSSSLPTSTTETQEIPDNVTAELEKLEQENGGMVEVEGVGDILGGLADDDDELLAEMGADFNILEYADPELDALTGGEKTNILDSLDLEESEPDKDVKKDEAKQQIMPKAPPQQPIRNLTGPAQPIVHAQVVQRPNPPPASPVKSPQEGVQPPPLTVSESHQPQPTMQLSAQQQQIQQQMQQQVAQAAAMGRPMAPGTRLLSPDGALGIVTNNNTITVTYPPNLQQRVSQSQLQFPNQVNRVQLRMAPGGMTRMVSVGPGSNVMHASHIGLGPQGPRIGLPPPPPPPYPGPPPPYPGPAAQMGLRGIGAAHHLGPPHLPMGLMHLPGPPQGAPVIPHVQRRPLLLQEQPLLLEDLLEQEKREQEKQMQTQPQNNPVEQQQPTTSNNQSVFCEQDFEKLKVDILRTVSLESPPQGLPAQGLLPVTSVAGNTIVRQAFQNQGQTVQGQSPQWQQTSPRPATAQPSPAPAETTSRVPTFNAPLLPAPPLPPEHIVSEQDRQTQLHYENWLHHQNSILSQQLKYYETEVQKLRKIRKSLNSKQRQLKKSGNSLAEPDALELKRISAEQAILQKQLESSRKQSRQHGMLIQEYRNKQQAKQQRPQSGQSPLMMGQQTQSPLGPPASSPIHSTTTPQSPMMSPSASPMMTQHNSPLHSPAPLVCPSPGSASIGMLQSPGNQASSSMSPIGMQPSPRIGTPHSQGEESPGPAQSPQMILPPPTPRMTSPQHRRLVTSPVGYTGDHRPQQIGSIGQRFVRPAGGVTAEMLMTPKPRMSLQTGFQQVIRPGGPSPLGSPQPGQQQILTPQQHQLLLQRQQQLQQQNIALQQQQQQQQQNDGQQENNNLSQRTLQMIHQRQLIIQQQQLAQQRQLLMQQQAQQGNLTPQQLQHQQLLQQQQLAKQQQLAQMQQQGGKSPKQQPPNSPMPPRSPMIQGQSMMSPHHGMQTPQSPMPPKSPLILGYGNPPSSSPMPRSPMLHQVNQTGNSPVSLMQQQINQHHGNVQTPSSPIARSPILNQMPSPMGIRRPPSTSSSPAIPDRPQSVENPGTPRTPYPQSPQSGGGNPHNPNNPIPSCPGFGRIGYFKLGLRGGSPMWSFGRGSKRPPTLPQNLDDKAGSSEITGAKIKKESHISKVSILKKKPAVKVAPTQTVQPPKVASLVCADYNEFDDSSSTPPVTPPPLATTSINKKIIQKSETLIEEQESDHVMIIDSSPEEKHMQCENLVDYDYDNDKTLVTTEVSLSSVAQQVDSDDIAVIESFTQGELGDVISSPLESEVAEEYVLFPTDVVVDIVDANENMEDQEFTEKDGDDEDEYSDMINIDGKNVEIVAIQSPTSSDEELIKSGKTKELSSDSFRLNLMQELRTNQSITDTPESPDQEEMNVDPPSPGPFGAPSDDFMASLGDSEIVIIDPTIKSPEEHIATKEDFEELIDGEKRDEKMHLTDPSMAKQLAEMHKYAAVFESAPQNYHWSVSSPTYSSSMNETNTTSTETKNTVSTPLVSPVQNLQTKPNKIDQPRITVTSIITGNTITVPILVANTSDKTTVSNVITKAEPKPEVFKPKMKYTNKETSPSLSLNTQVASLPNKIFEDECTSPDESICQDDPYSPIRKAFASEPFKKEPTPVTKTPDIEEPKPELEAKSQTPITKSLLEQTFKLDDPKKVYTIKTPNSAITITNENKIIETVSKMETVAVGKQVSKEVVHNITLSEALTQENCSIGNICVAQRDGKIETMPASFITHTELGDNNMDLDSKSVVISIPSPTPSQEQMLDNIAMQELETRRRDGKGLPTEFDSIEDVLNMIENITGDQPIMDKMGEESKDEKAKVAMLTKSLMDHDLDPPKMEEKEKPKEIKITEAHVIASNTKSTTVPQLSPLSPATELTTNMANVSQQLRTLLSSLQTNTITTSSNVESIAKPVEKEHIVTNVTIPSNSVMTSRIIQQTGRMSPQVTSTIKKIPVSVIPSTTKEIIRTQPNVSQVIYNTSTPLIVSTVISSNSNLISTSLAGIISSARTSNSGGIQLMPDHPKLPLITTVVGSHSVNNLIPSQISILNTAQNLTTSSVVSLASANSSAISTSYSTAMSMRKSTPSLNAMLQSHPAATVPQSVPGTITAASLLGTSRSGYTPTSSVQGSLVSPAFTSVRSVTTSSLLSSSLSQPTTSSIALTNITPKSLVTTTNLLHTQLTKAPLKRSKSIDDPSAVGQSHFIKKEELPMRSESLDDSSQVSSTIKQEQPSGCKYSTVQTPSRTEDSQNVLLKQLLQNTGCASTQAPSTTVSLTTTSLPIVPSLEAQLARPVPPTPTTLLPPLLQNDQAMTSQPPKTTRHSQIMSRETSFVSRPPQKSPTTVATTNQLHIDIKKCALPSRTPSRDELLSPPTPRSSGGGSQESSLQTPPLIIKKEATTTVPYPSPSPVSQINLSQIGTQEVKKELIDESSQHSEVSDMSRPDIPTKEESMDAMDNLTDKMAQDQAAIDLKKLKRRHYQQKRRQNQLLSKDLAGQPKKRPRKSSRVEEDYDTFIENLMVQLRQLPPMTVTEPILGRNFGVCSVYGSGDLSKIGTKGYDTRLGDLVGDYGNAVAPGKSDFYATKPYGDQDPLPEKPAPSTQRLFYDQEFPPIKFDIDDDRKLELFCRDNETPDSIVSSSSPECTLVESPVQFPGLRLISEDDDDSDSGKSKRMSPIIPIIAPIPIRLKPTGPFLKDYADVDKENFGSKDHFNLKSKFAKMPTNPLKDSGNVTVTLTLTSAAAEDIMGVLRDLANILHIPAPTSYQIVERTSTPPSHKLGLYRTKGKDGKEGAPIDIQSILNGAAKFCKHCDVVILNNLIRKRTSELPFLSKEPELLGDGDELYFCSSTCYMQFALMHRSPTMTQDKVAAIVDHLCQDKTIMKKKQFDDKTNNILEKCTATENLEKMDVDEIVNSIKQECMDEIAMAENLQKELMETKIKTEVLDPSSPKKTKKHPSEDTTIQQPPVKQFKGLKYRHWAHGGLQPRTKYKRPSDKEIMETMFRMGITVIPQKIPDDTRKCMFCNMTADGVADGPARLLNFDVDKWVHLNCALWSEGVYETVNGALMNLENALSQSLITACIHCQKFGATVHCFKTRCSNVYHLGCAVKDNCVFYKDKTILCTSHALRNEKDNELTTLSVSRRVYVQRDENRQVAAVMHQSDHNHLLRVGSLIFLSVGQLLPHQLQNFHNANYIYPIGYKIIRFYWSMRRINKRCRYICSIHDQFGRPEFRVLVQEPSHEDVEYRDNSPKAVWNKVLEPLTALRKEHSCVQLYPQYVTGEDLFGLTEPAVVRVLESLPGIETLSDYRFKYGRNPLLELPLAINPTGAARSEPKLRNQFPWKRPHTQRTGSSARPVFVSSASGAGEAACPYSKQFVHSKSSQYKKMKQEWRNNVYLARSKIQGLGLYAARDLEKHTMVIEYIGEIIRTELAETREKAYEAKNRGIYMFRLDEERVVDATLCGGLARYINHSCNPNCVAEIVEVDRDLRIIIFAKRRIARGEELAYDYKFDIEDDQHKISCMCGAPNCRKWMN